MRSNAGGGGERVLWTAVEALQVMYPDVRCAIFTGDSASDADIIANVGDRFGIRLRQAAGGDAPSSLLFVRLKRRKWLEDKSYPRFTLLLQSLGSVFVALEALSLLVPDVFIGTVQNEISVYLLFC